jgi:hypothetical protein
VTEHPNAALYREAWENFRIGDTESVASLMDDDIANTPI